MVASIVLGCAAGGASGPIETGALEITVDSLPAGAEAAIAVSNTQGFNEVVTHSTTITGLVIGSYTVTASDVTVGSERFFAVAESQSVTVGSSSVTATVHVAYVLATPETTGALTVTVSGMSNGVAASVTVTGPSAFSQLLTATQTLSSLTPGSYTVTAAAVTSGATTYTPQPASQTVNVAAGATASASAVYSSQTYATLTPGYHARSMTVVNWAGKPVIFDYKIYVPTGYAPTRQWPVILAAHGSGEDGGDGVTDHSNNNTAQLNIGLGAHLSALGEQAVVVFAQVPNLNIDQALLWQLFVRLHMTALQQTLAEVNADPTRIYAVGNSSGAFQIWDLLYQSPGVFAAGIPAAGGINSISLTGDDSTPQANGPAIAVARLSAMPIWIFNADDDSTVPYNTYGLPIVNEWASMSIGDPPFKHTLYHAIGGHQATWDTAFASAATWTWLFAQHR